MPGRWRAQTAVAVARSASIAKKKWADVQTFPCI